MTEQQLDDAIAELLRAGATYSAIRKQLAVGDTRIRRIRDQHAIALPPGRAKRTRAELDALQPQVLAMLRAGATVWAIRTKTRVRLNEISRLRREAGLPIPKRGLNAGKRVTVDEAYATYALTYPDSSHVLWAGPRSGRSLDLIASGHRYNARAVAFAKHHGRPHEGILRRTCHLPTCIAGAHHTDLRIRTELKDTAHAR